MKLRYLVVDNDAQLLRKKRCEIESLWQGRRRAHELGCEQLNELKLVSVLCDAQLVPQKIYLLRLPLCDGRFTRANYRTLRTFSRPGLVTARELFLHHIEGWPHDFFMQLAVALDVPRSHLDVPLGIGGPLMMAAALRLPPTKAMRYLR